MTTLETAGMLSVEAALAAFSRQQNWRIASSAIASALDQPVVDGVV